MTEALKMTAEHKLKHLILLKAVEMKYIEPLTEEVTAENVDALFEANNQDWELQDPKNELRGGQHETNLPVGYQGRGLSYYESQSVAMQYLDGSWIGWTYWYGGGKHAEPEAIDWIEAAYDVTVTEEPRTIIHRTFTKVEPE